MKCYEFSHFTDVENWLRKVKELAQHHRAAKWQSRDSNPHTLVSRVKALIKGIDDRSLSS